MANYWSDTYGDIQPVVKDFLDNEGGEVSDLALSTINRAVHRIWQRRFWTYLTARASLSLDSNDQASVPSDYGRVHSVYYDSDSDGNPDFFFYFNSERTDRRIIWVNTFTLAAGHTRKIEFAKTPSYTPVIRYQKALEKFTGAAAEYSYFPASLVIIESQVLHATENGWADKGELTALMAARDRELRDYEQAHQFLNEPARFEAKDDRGMPFEIEEYSIEGGYEQNPGATGIHDNDYDYGYRSY